MKLNEKIILTEIDGLKNKRIIEIPVEYDIGCDVYNLKVPPYFLTDLLGIRENVKRSFKMESDSAFPAWGKFVMGVAEQVIL